MFGTLPGSEDFAVLFAAILILTSISISVPTQELIQTKMPSEPLHMFDPRRTIQLQGFSGRAATTTIHDATETGLQISGIFQAAEDFANVQVFSAYDYYNHLRLKPLPVTDLSGVTLQFDMQVLPVNGEEGNVRPD